MCTESEKDKVFAGGAFVNVGCQHNWGLMFRV